MYPLVFDLGHAAALGAKDLVDALPLESLCLEAERSFSAAFSLAGGRSWKRGVIGQGGPRFHLSIYGEFKQSSLLLV